MKKTKLSLIAIMTIIVLLFSACGNSSKTNETNNQNETTSEEGNTKQTSENEEKSTTPLVVGFDHFNGKFSPFFADTDYDQTAQEMTQVQLLTTDRTGGIVYNAIEGETIPYNGTDYTYKGIANVDINYDEASDKTTYTWTIRDDVKFSDGELLTADDIIFTYYVLSDPSYDGSSTLYSLPIIGMQDYRTQTSSEVYDKYDKMFDEIYALGSDYKVTDNDSFTQEQVDALWTIVDEEWKKDVQGIIDYVLANYSSYFPDQIGYTAEEVSQEEGLQVAAGMTLWGFASVDLDTKVLTTSSTGNTYNLANGEYPTVDDYYAECVAAYEDFASYAEIETAQDVSPFTVAKNRFISTEGPKDPSLGGKGVPNIAGIKKISDTQVEVTLDGFDAVAIYQLGGIDVAPLHYYGDESQYDYENNKFGFPYGDLSLIREKTSQPMGAGPYRFIKYDNKVIYYEANEYYWKGEPKTYYMQFKEGNNADKISGVATGTIDITDPSFGTAAVEEIKSYNSNGEISGDVIVTSTVDNLGYGYIGINANIVNVGGVAGSEKSKYLRKGIATVLAVYRDLAIDSYYGERASVINYPISNTSWAAPQKSDEGYEIAFSKDINGDPIYTSEMTAEEKYAAALEAAKEYFIAAGYTYDEASGKFTAAPEGAKLEYEMIVPGNGDGEHPSFMIATMFKDAMESIGFSIVLNDPTDANVLWDKLDAKTQEIWCAAWAATIDPDMYQIYHSSNSTNSNHYGIADPELDKLIIDARKSDDQTYRKATYKACLDIIIDWAVEVPIYQRQNCIIFSAERVNLDTVTPDITTFWGWAQDIELLEMNE